MESVDSYPVIVLAGGASRRMGMDKRTLPIDGVPMLQRTLDRLGSASILVVVDPRDPLPFCLPGNARAVPDTRPGEGPLAALEAASAALERSVALVVAADMPWVEPVVLRLLVDRLAARPDAMVACLGDDRGPRPLPLAVRPERVLPRITALLDGGERRLWTLLVDALVVPLPDWLPLDPDRATLRDVDTAADLAGVP